MPEAEEREFRDEAALLWKKGQVRLPDRCCRPRHEAGFGSQRDTHLLDSGPSSPKDAGYGPLRGEKEVDVGAG
jgi:hypothetical protein